MNSKACLLLNLLMIFISCSTKRPNTVIGVVSKGHFNQPQYLALTPDGSTAYVPNPPDNTVSIINTAIHSVVGNVQGTFKLPLAIAITPDGSVGYVTNFDNESNSVSYFSTKTHRVLGTVDDSLGVFNGPLRIAITPNGSKAYVISSRNKSVGIIDIKTNKTTGKISGFNFPVSIAIAPDGLKSYVVDQDNKIYIIDVTKDTIIGTISDKLLGPTDIAITPNGKLAYVTVFNTDSVIIVDLATHTVIGQVNDPLKTFEIPSYIAITADGLTGYVSNNPCGKSLTENTISSSTVSIIDLTTNSVIGLVHDPLRTFYLTQSIVIHPRDNFVYVVNGALWHSGISIMVAPN